MKRRNPFPGVSRVTDRHGEVRFRFRRKGFDTYLPGPYASAEFRAAYEAAGIDEFVYLGQDVLKTLERAHALIAGEAA